MILARDASELCFMGIDVGSLSSKAVLMVQKEIVAHSIIPTGANPRIAARTVLENLLKASGKNREQVACIVGTGYGRVNLPFVDYTITELTCHARGAHHLNPQVRTVIDIGGQDSKVIRVDQHGNMVDFAMNDKCAAGTGRFLEVMAKALEIDLNEIAEYSARAKTPCSINNTCAVFAESEVISLLANGNNKEDITAGLHSGIARRVGNMVKRLGPVREIAFVGGVAKNRGAKEALEEYLGVRFTPAIQDPQINGALGAAVLAGEMFQRGNNQFIGKPVIPAI